MGITSINYLNLQGEMSHGSLLGTLGTISPTKRGVLKLQPCAGFGNKMFGSLNKMNPGWSGSALRGHP